MVELFSELGRRLEALSRGENADYQSVIASAAEKNSWFSVEEIRLAAGRLATDMLSRDALTEWLAAYPHLPTTFVPVMTQPADILIVMAGNVPLVGLQDLICVLAADHRAIVKPSSKDTVLMRWVVAQLLDIEPLTPVSFEGEPAVVIAMGGDDTIAALRMNYGDLPMLLRGHRSSLAVLDGSENETQLNGLTDDILTFSGLGCRNVSLVFVPHGYDFSTLQSIVNQRVPSLNLKYRNNLGQSRAKLRMSAVPHIDCGASLFVESRDFPNNITICNYAFYDDISEVKIWISEHTDTIQCVAEKNAGKSVKNSIELGKTQRPTLFDYPNGIDTLKFLLSIK